MCYIIGECTQVGWYNNQVDGKFNLPYDEDVLAWIVISIPSMFEKLFKPFILSEWSDDTILDPLDECMKRYFATIQRDFSQHKFVVIQDFELHPDRRPKVLVQTAGHTAGACYYYQRQDLQEGDPWPESKNIYGVSVHPQYGGWFAFRGVLVFPDVKVPNLAQVSPPDCVPTNEMRVDLLRKFNENWQDWSYRDVLNKPIREKYSEEQKIYFGTFPVRNRIPLLKNMKDGPM